MIKDAPQPMDRRTFLKLGLGAAAAAALTPKDLFTPQTAEAQEGDPIRNTFINEAPFYKFIHPVSERGEIWSYGFTLRTAVPNSYVYDKGTVGQIFIGSEGTNLGFDTKTNPRYIHDYKGQDGVQAAVWVRNGQPGDVLVLMDETNDQEPTALAQVELDGGFGGILVPDAPEVQFGVRIVRQQPGPDVEINFGNISATDARLGRHKSVLDVGELLGVAESKVPAQNTQLGAATTEAGTPDGVQNMKINEAPAGVWFHQMSQDGQVWSYGISMRKTGLPNTDVKDLGEVGKVYLTGKDAGIDLQTDPKYLADYRANGARAALWFKAGAGDHVILMNEHMVPVAEVVADDKGFAGAYLPDDKKVFGMRVLRAGGSDPIEMRVGNISHEDYAKPRHASVMDISEKLK